MADVILLIGLGLAVVLAYPLIDTGGSAADGPAHRVVKPATSPDATTPPHPLLVAPEVTAIINAPHPGRDGVVLTLRGDTEHHHGRIATTKITIAPSESVE